MKEKWAFIINPVAGAGFAAHLAPAVQAQIQKRGLDAEIFYTKARGHATELARQAAEKNFTHIAVVAGDGTFHEAVAGIYDKNVRFVPISSGTGNDFIPILGFSSHFTEKDWDILFERHEISIDIGFCNENIFINGMGLGLDAYIGAQNYKKTKNPDDFPGPVKKGPKMKYTFHILKGLFFYRELPVQITVNGKSIEKNILVNSIGIGRRQAAGMMMTPKAIANDGKLDATIVGPQKLFGRLKMFSQAGKNELLSNPAAEFFRSDHFHYEFQKKVFAHLDGEILFSQCFDIKVLKGQLKTYYNPYFENYLRI